MADMLTWILLAGTSVLAAVLAIPKGLWSRWNARSTDRIDHSLRRRITRFGHRYRDFLLGSLRFIDLKGLATVGFYTPELDEVFVDVSLAYRPPHQVQGGVLSQVPDEVTDRHSINEFLSREQPVILAVLGGPGSGKTTLLRHTAQEICRSPDSKRQVPALLYLRDHVKAIVASPAVTLPELIRATLGDTILNEPPGWFEQQLRDGNCVILLDGLDEVAEEDHRTQLSNWVERQTSQYPKNDFVITSRPLGYQSAKITGALVLQVRSFTEDQISQFVHAWYIAMERHSTGVSTDEIRVRAQAASKDLLARLRDAPALDDLTVNPLLLTMITNVHRYRGVLPGSRGDLYSEICQVMLWRRAEAKNMSVSLNGEGKESLLRGLAFTMMQRRVRDLPRADILHELKTALLRVSTTLTEEDFLADATSNGLLVERESGVFAFAHLTFQEYLASAYIRDKGERVQVLADAVDDIWWRETTLLYAAKADADPIVAACLRSASVTALMLAFDCVDQGRELAPELRDDLERILDTDKPSPELAKARTGLLVARHLRQLTRTASGGRVCTRPISLSIYQLFVADNPDHWLWPTSLIRDAPVTGVHASAATAFVHWVNTITNGDPGYRLPYASEVIDPAVVNARSRFAKLSVWTAEKGQNQRPVLWTPPRAKHPHLLHRADLRHHVERDLRATHAMDKARLIRTKVIIVALQEATGRVDELSLLGSYRRTIDQCLLKSKAVDHTFLLTNLAAYEREMRNKIRNMSRSLTHCLRRAAVSALIGVSPRTTEQEVVDHVSHVFTIARDIARDRAGDLDVLIDEACTLMMGRTLSLSFAHTLSTLETTVPGQLADALLRAAGITKSSSLASPDVLRTKCPHIPGHVPHSWARDVASQLDKSLCAALCDVTTFLQKDIVAQVRLPALLLAGEAGPEDHGMVEFEVRREWLRMLVSSVTLLERKIDDEAPVTETIMLATT